MFLLSFFFRSSILIYICILVVKYLERRPLSGKSSDWVAYKKDNIIKTALNHLLHLCNWKEFIELKKLPNLEIMEHNILSH